MEDKKNEILSACRELYDKENFKDITIKQIGELITLSRPSIYNYFETKEEIFLYMFQKEYESWNKEIQSIIENNETLTKEKFSCLLAHTLEDKKVLLKLLSTNLYDIEENSRMSCLVEFKKAYKDAIHSIKECIIKFFPEKSNDEVINFLYTFFPFMYGIYPYAVVTEKQKVAMEQAGIDYKYFTIYEIAYNGILKLLG